MEAYRTKLIQELNSTLSLWLVSADNETALLVALSSGSLSHKNYADIKGCVHRSYKYSWLKTLCLHLLATDVENHKISSWSLRPWKIRPIYIFSKGRESPSEATSPPRRT
jgi:hypothetical protein